jgi:hypothetical protein
VLKAIPVPVGSGKRDAGFGCDAIDLQGNVMRTHFRRESSRQRALHARGIWQRFPSICESLPECSRGTIGPMRREAIGRFLCLACTLAALAAIPLLGLCWLAIMQGASPLAALP